MPTMNAKSRPPAQEAKTEAIKATPFERSIDVHISHLRRKLETGDRTLIRTVRGVGYLFVAADEK